MKKFLIVLLALFGSVAVVGAQDFDKFFEPKTLRMDYIHAGNCDSESFYFERFIEEPHFAGSRKSLIDTNNLGNQYLKVFDLKSGDLIYSRGYCTLFSEWDDTDEAQIVNKAYKESAVMPYPLNSIRIELHSRNKKGEFEKVFEHQVDPRSPYIINKAYNLPVFDVHYTGVAENRVDIVLLPEGYAEHEKEKFEQACEKFAKEIFTYSPLKENAKRINIRAVWKASEQSGISMPGENYWVNTAMDSKFYTFESERYIMIDDFQGVRDVAGNAPYDLIYVLANTQKYGGGAIYNFYGISTANNPESTGKVYVHEFGHLLLGLGDEYVGTTSMDDMYPDGVEPWELNLTRLIDFKKNKKDWSDMIDDNMPIPSEVKDENGQKVGVYEGGGYQAKGIYRPWINCMMNTLKDSEFCPVCSKGINDMIDFVCE